jgi:2-polyprenyl-6-methoxyphenol hydroxylase-like FAD-dependent oxidoreductase
MLPHAASGGTSAIEDAAVLAECIEWAFQSGHGVSQGTEVYEELRKTRVERMQQAAREGYGFLNAEGELAEERDRMLAAETKSVEAELQLSEKEKRTKIVPEADIQAPFPSPPYMQWLYRADVLKDARSYLAGLSLSAE